MASGTQCPPLMYPEKFELAMRYGEGPLQSDSSLSDSDRVLIYALGRQAVDGMNKEPRPSMFDTVGKAKWTAWKELGNRSKMEAMFMYVTAVEEVRVAAVPGKSWRGTHRKKNRADGCCACMRAYVCVCVCAASAVRPRLVEVAGARAGRTFGRVGGRRR